MVIFDEPSAALDSRTENKILSNVMKSSNGKLSIIITHRFLNIKKVNEIIVLKLWVNLDYLFRSSYMSV